MKLTISLIVIAICSSCSSYALPRRTIGSRVVGGEPARAGQFPFSAAIYTTTPNGNYFCGGALISAWHIATAGHCVDGVLLFTIILGTNNLQELDENSQRFATEHYFLHPDYNPNTLEHNLGIIRLRSNVQFTDYIDRVNMPYSGMNPGDTGTVIGWGQIDDEGSPNSHLNYVDMVLLTEEECRLTYGDQIKENFICFAGAYNEGTCIGDSGSPVLSTILTNFVQIQAVATFLSANGCESTDPSGFLLLAPYSGWLTIVTNNMTSF